MPVASNWDEMAGTKRGLIAPMLVRTMSSIAVTMQLRVRSTPDLASAKPPAQAGSGVPKRRPRRQMSGGCGPRAAMCRLGQNEPPAARLVALRKHPGRARRSAPSVATLPGLRPRRNLPPPSSGLVGRWRSPGLKRMKQNRLLALPGCADRLAGLYSCGVAKGPPKRLGIIVAPDHYWTKPVVVLS